MSAQNSDAGSGGPGSSTPRTSRPRKYMCWRGDECGMVFDNLIDLDLHMKKRGHWRCSKCGDDYQDKRALDEHDVRAHPEPMNLKCPGCDEKFTRAGNLMCHIEYGRCRVLKPELLHLRRKQRQAFQEGLRRLNPANELDFLEPMPNDGARPHMKPDNNFIKVVHDLEYYSTIAGPMTAKYRRGTSKAPDLLTGDNLEALNYVPRYENDTFSAWKEPEMKVPQQEAWATADPEPVTLPVMHGRRIVDPDLPDFNVAIFFNPVYERFACPHLRCNKEFTREKALIDHLQSMKHKPKIEISCPHCGRLFNTMTAAMNHAEASTSRKCLIQHNKHFRQFVYQVSGCILDVAGETLQSQPRFVNVSEDDLFSETQEAWDGCESLASQLARLRAC